MGRLLAFILLLLLAPVACQGADSPAQSNPASVANARAMKNGARYAGESSQAIAPSSVYASDTMLAPGAVTVQEAGVAHDLDDYDSEPVASISDPLEPWNRFWFRFNDIF